MKRLFNLTSAITAGLLVACPIRNLQNLRDCFGMPDVVMDVPAGQLRLEASLLIVQVCLAALGGLALYLGAQTRPTLQIGAGLSWTLVGVGGFVWDKALGEFVGETLSSTSALGCILDRRSAHTHTMLSNGPLLLAVGLAFWVIWEARSARTRSRGRTE
jgi:hypothetical protein